MEKVFLSILPLALFSSISPVTIAFTIHLLGSKEKPLSRAIWYAAGVASVFVAFGVLVLLGFNAVDLIDSISNTLRDDAVVRILAGSFLLAIGVQAIFFPRQKNKHPHPSSVSTKRLFLLGVTMNLTNVTSFAPMAVALKNIETGGVGFTDQALLLGAYLVIMLWAYWIPISLVAIFGQSVSGKLAKANQVAMSLIMPVLLYACIAFGVYFIVTAFLDWTT